MKTRSHLSLPLTVLMGLAGCFVPGLKAGTLALTYTTVSEVSSTGYETGLSEPYLASTTTTGPSTTTGFTGAYVTRIYWGNFGEAGEYEDGFRARMWAGGANPETYEGFYQITVLEAIQVARFNTLTGTTASWTAEAYEVPEFELTAGSILEPGDYTLSFSFTPTSPSVTDLDSGIFFTVVPEPGVAALGVVGGLLLFRRSRRVS